MEMENQIKKAIIEIIKPTQITAASHLKNSISLKKVYEISDFELFTSAFKKILVVILVSHNGNGYIEKTMDFLALFCSILKPQDVPVAVDDESVEIIDHPLVMEIITYLLETAELANNVVRFRSCQLINKILDRMVGTEVSNTLCYKLEKCLLMRLQDPKSAVRQQAVLAIHRLQDPTNIEDKIIQQFINLMDSDLLAKIRLLCIENIAARTDVISHIIGRIRDVDINVRLAAYKRLSNLAKYLQISQRRYILNCGFLGDSDKIKRFVTTNLVPKWLQHYDGNILLLMKSIRLDADEKDTEETATLWDLILESFFRTKPIMELNQVLNLNDKKLVSIEALNWETVAYWRSYVQFLNKNTEYEEELEKVIPELIIFCKYVKEYCTSTQTENTAAIFLEKQFILKQLFLIIRTYDFAEVTNRQCLNSLVCNILEKIDLMADVTEVIVKSLEYSIPDVNNRSQFVCEIISEIIFPMDAEEYQRKEQEREFELSKIMVKINCLLEEQNNAVTEENFIEADRLKKEIVQLNATYKELKHLQNLSPPRQIKKRTDIPTIIKYLNIAASLLLSPQITELLPSLKTLKNDVIQELLIHDNDNVRSKAFKCYALCCIVDKGCALLGIHIFSAPIFAYQNGEECDTQTLLICIGAAIDLIRMYGPQLMAAPDDNVLSESMDEAHERVFAGGTSLTDLIQGLVDLMDDEQFEIQFKAAVGLCQLILSDRIHSPSLISRLVLKWCNPSINGDSMKIVQIIGFTLERIPFLTDNTEQLEHAVIITVKALANAPKFSPLADVNIVNIGHFMIALCKTSPKSIQIQSNLAIKLCFEIKDSPRSELNITLSKMLLLLEIPNDKLIIKDLMKICNKLQDEIKERLVVNNVVKFMSSLTLRNIDDLVVEE